ncbi:MAG: CAAD domains of cyanobacterial aminoacyl-tRNA synthetase-domain-containing protein [Monoraphidium minutum]|nr:MAG: CAAD domains of cyanobacterial aminoacyl-tRNA synthetase-domain-containing protein [Monoraphidium minutum]
MLAPRALAAKPALARAAPACAPVRPASAMRRVAVRAEKPELDAEKLKETVSAWANEASSTIKVKWEKTEDKPAAVMVTAGGIVALTLALGVVHTVDKIPIVSDFVELVGISVSGYLAYRYLTVGPDRDELFLTLKGWWSKIYGNTTSKF